MRLRLVHNYVALPIYVPYKIIFQILYRLTFPKLKIYTTRNFMSYGILCMYIVHVYTYMNKCIGLEVCSGVTSIAKDHNNCYKIEAILLCN